MSQPNNPELSQQTKDDPRFRPLTLHERFCLMRENTGRPQVIIHVVTYPIAQLPSYDFLAGRITELQERFPLLHSGIAFAGTTRPAYAEGYTFSPFQLIQDIEAETDDPVELYRIEMDRMSKAIIQPNDNRRLNILRITAGEKGFLILSLSHMITDGKGSTSLLHALTCPEEDIPAKEGWEQPTRFDDTVSTSPSLLFLVPVALRELVLPKLPKFLQAPFIKDDPWPGPVPSPLDRPWDILLLKLEPDLVTSVKAAGKKHGVKTLHPILKTAYLASLWRVFGGSTPIRFATATARNERKAELGHAAVTHNYVSSTEWNIVLSGDDTLWNRAREFASKLASPEGLIEGRMTMGLLSLIPDPAVDTEAPDYDPLCPTGWEKFFLERARSANPFRCSMDMSNLGKVSLPPGASDAFWGQTATPFSAAHHVNVIGHEGGIRITSTWIEGSSGTRKESEEVHRVFRKVLGRLGDGEATVAEITA